MQKLLPPYHFHRSGQHRRDTAAIVATYSHAQSSCQRLLKCTPEVVFVFLNSSAIFHDMCGKLSLRVFETLCKFRAVTVGIHLCLHRAVTLGIKYKFSTTAAPK
jgi:hypothetical protein